MKKLYPFHSFSRDSHKTVTREKKLKARQMELLHMLEDMRTEENKEEVDSILNRFKSIS